MRTSKKRIIVKRAATHAALLPFQAKLLARYRWGKYQKYPIDQLNIHLPWVRCFLEGLSEAEHAAIHGGYPWTPEQRKRALLLQRARLIARRLGIRCVDVHISGMKPNG